MARTTKRAPAPDTIVVNGVTYVRADVATVADPAIAAASAHFRARDIACSATPPCSRTDLRTAKRAASHGPEGHFAR